MDALDAPRLAALADAFYDKNACPTPAEEAREEGLILDGAAPAWLRVGDPVSTCSRDPEAFRSLEGDRAVVCPDPEGGDVVRVLLYEDATPDDALRAAFVARASRPGAAPRDAADADAFVAAVVAAGWRVDELPVAFDRGRLLRAPPAGGNDDGDDSGA